jgi:hypothetical protein
LYFCFLIKIPGNSEAIEKHCSNGEVFIPYSLFHSSSGHWVGVDFKVSDLSSGQVLLLTSMCKGTSETSGLCVQSGKDHKVEVTGTLSSGQIAWEICGRKGGTPFTMTFSVDPKTGLCEPKCENVETTVELFPGLDDLWASRGWAGSYYHIISTNSGVFSFILFVDCILCRRL